VSFAQPAEFEGAAGDMPDGLIDVLATDIFPGAGGGDVDPLPVPPEAPMGPDGAHLEAVGRLEGWRCPGVDARRQEAQAYPPRGPLGEPGHGVGGARHAVVGAETPRRPHALNTRLNTGLASATLVDDRAGQLRRKRRAPSVLVSGEP
jgi:hypothetical protein